jgi:hypothetical protein
MTAKQMLKMGGFPDTEQGRAAFYKKYPSEDAFMKKYAKGGSLAFPQAPTADQIFSMGMPATFPGPFYAHGGSHMPLVHFQDAGQVNPQAMMDNRGGNNSFPTRQPGGPPMPQLPSFEEGGMDPRMIAEQMLVIRQEYSEMTPRELEEEFQNIQEAIASGYDEDPSLVMKQTVLAEMLGQEMPMAEEQMAQNMQMAQTGGIAFPQQPNANQFFTGAHFNNEYRKGGAPCYKCGGMYDTGGNTPFNYGYFPMGMAMGGGIGLDTSDNSDYLSYAPGGEAPQGFDMQNLRDNSLNQFKTFLSNQSNQYQQEQAMGQYPMGNGMPQLPQNNMGGYDANYNMNYGNNTDTDSFSSMNPNALNNISNYENAIDNYTIPGAANNFAGNVFDLIATRQMQKQGANANASNPAKAKYGRFLPKHQNVGVNSQATNTGNWEFSDDYQKSQRRKQLMEAMQTKKGIALNPNITDEDLEKLARTEGLIKDRATQQGNQQQTGIINPFTGQMVNTRSAYRNHPMSKIAKVKYRYDDAKGTHEKLKFNLYPGYGNQAAGTQGTTTQGQGAGAASNLNDYAKYIEALGKAGFKMDKEVHKRGLFRNKDVYKYHFGEPTTTKGPVQGPVQGPANNPKASLMNPSSTITPNIPATQYPATQYNSGVDQMSEKFADESGVDINTMRRGGYNNDDVVWMDEDDIRRFEAGGGVLQYLDGGEFKQYY